jgi:co-chaperonin GroES (HSP10)
MSNDLNIQPLGNRVLVLPAEPESKTSSGLLLPETSKEKPLVGKVMAVGEDEEMPVKVGHKVHVLRRRCSSLNTPARRSNWTALST